MAVIRNIDLAWRMVQQMFSDTTPVHADRWLALHTTSGNSQPEVNGGGYQRARIQSDNYRRGTGAQRNRLIFDTNEADFLSTSTNRTSASLGTITHFGIYDAATGGNLLGLFELKDSGGNARSLAIGSNSEILLGANQYIEMPYE